MYYNELYSDDSLIQCGYELIGPGGHCIICGEKIDSDDLFANTHIVTRHPDTPDFYCRACASEEVSEHNTIMQAQEQNAEMGDTETFRTEPLGSFTADLNQLIKVYEYLEEKYRHITRIFFVNPDLMNYFVQGKGSILTGIPVYQSEKVPLKEPIGFENWTDAYKYAKEHELFSEVVTDIIKIKAENET